MIKHGYELYAIDWEWHPVTGEPQFGRIDGGVGKVWDMEPGKTYRGPTEIKGLVGYFLARNDIAFSRPYVNIEKYIDLKILEQVVFNQSRRVKDNRFSLEEIVKKRLKRPMSHTMKVHDHPNVTHELRVHCREDTQVTRELLEFYMAIITPEQLETAFRLQELNEPWFEIDKQGIHYDAAWLKSLVNPETLVPRLNKEGLDFFALTPNKRTGKLKMTILRQRFQDFLWNNGFENHLELVNSTVSYAKSPDGEHDGELLQMHWQDFEKISKHALDPKIRELSTLIYIALRSHYAQSGDIRFKNDIIKPFEITRSQDSGRVSHLNCPISAGVIFRMAVIPPPGMKTLVIDIKSEEIMLAAEFSGDKEMQKASLEDFYSYVACLLDGIPYVKLDKNHPTRVRVKGSISLPYIYGVEANTVSRELNCPKDYAAMIIDKLNRGFETFYFWGQQIQKDAFTAGQVHTLLDKFPLKVKWCPSDPREDANPKQVVNHAIQGTAADLLFRWVGGLVKEGYVPFATLHDGLYFYVPEDFDAQILVRLSQDILNKALPLTFTDTWIVEPAEFKGHLVEKGDAYFEVVAKLKNTSLMQERQEEEDYIARREL